jgi:mono/diheme cytochrome c family protein
MAAGAMVVASGIMLTPSAIAAGQNDRFTNIGSIANTRHNMMQDTTIPSVSIDMDRYRNNYGEVCVYCHTPHGANQTIAAPLWNRTIKATNYQTYDELGTTTLTQVVSSTPGPASLTCLSCHDGQTAVDSIINMPGSGSAGATAAQIQAQSTTQSTAFLNLWTPPPGVTDATNHMGLNSSNGVLGDGTGNRGCLVCHSETGALGGGLADFTLFNIGTDLRNDHPVGITFPVLNGPGTDWNSPLGVKGSSNFFDDGLASGDNRMQKDEIRTYDGKVECASCHDPHGVPSAGAGTVFNKTFLRKQNTNGSAVCLTCHNK